MKVFQVPCGKGVTEFSLPEHIETLEIGPKEEPPVRSCKAAIMEAILNPIGTERLSQIAKPTDKVAVIVTDTTRKLPEDIIVPILLDELETAGIAMENVVIVNALGKHEPNSVEELTAMLGEEVMRRVSVINPDPKDPMKLKSIGRSRRGIPIVANDEVMEADLRITTGTIEPHLFAGYSGGVKSFSVGVAGMETLAATHNAEILDHPKTRLGVIKDNIFREFLNEAAMTVGIHFIVNVIQNGNKEVLGVFAGHPLTAFEAGVEKARTIFETNIEKDYDIVISAPGYPKSQNLYQATRAWNSVVFGPQPVVKKGGIIIIPTPCEKGFGEQSFYDILKAKSPQEIIDDARKYGFAPGEHKAFIAAKVFKQAHVVITNCLIPREKILNMRMGAAKDIQEALNNVLKERENPSVLIMPHGLLTLPILL